MSSRKSSHLVPITFESPCPGQLDELLAAASGEVLVAPNPGKKEDATRRHLRECSPCRRFLESLRFERRALSQAWARKTSMRRSPRQARVTYPASRRVSDWIEGQLRVHSEREISRTLCRLGKEILFLDPSFSIRRADRNVFGLAVDLHHLFTDLTEAAQHWCPERSRSALLEVTSVEGEKQLNGRQRQLELVGMLEKLATEIHPEQSLDLLVLRGFREWFLGSPEESFDLFVRACSVARSAQDQSRILNNLAVHRMERGQSTDAIQFATLAKIKDPGRIDVRINLCVWHFALGQRMRASREFSELSIRLDPHAISRAWPRERMRHTILSLERVLSLTTPRVQWIWSGLSSLVYGDAAPALDQSFVSGSAGK